MADVSLPADAAELLVAAAAVPVCEGVAEAASLSLSSSLSRAAPVGAGVASAVKKFSISYRVGNTVGRVVTMSLSVRNAERRHGPGPWE